MTGRMDAGRGEDEEDELAALRRSDGVLREELRDARSLVVQSQRELERARAMLDLVRADAARLREHIATICC